MDELMQAALGVGLAATQVGILHRLLVYRAYPEDPTTALVNPVLEWVSDELEAAEEGCLSLPGIHVEVERPARVRVRARDTGGAELLVEAEGLEARVIQHEIDHLDGVLILDRISREARRDAMRALREARVHAGPTPHTPAPAASACAACAPSISAPPSSPPPCSSASPAVRIARRSCFTRPDRPSGRGRKLTAPPVATAHSAWTAARAARADRRPRGARDAIASGAERRRSSCAPSER